MSKTSLLILEMLADGGLLSGESIGRQLGISRMAVSKTIKGLIEQGLEISSVSGKGYQLRSPLQLLDEKEIRSKLKADGNEINSIEILQTVASTSDYLLEISDENDIDRVICLAESQHRGRGRRQRQWLATPYRNITLSIGWRFNEGMAGLAGLGVATGITVARTLHESGFSRDIGLKWPNDILCHGRKLGGLLIDVRGEHDGPCLAVLGLGLNIALSADDQQNIDQPSISLEQLSGQSIDRNQLVADLIRALTGLFTVYSRTGFDSFYPLWPEYDRLSGKEVNVIRGKNSFSGLARGIDESGALMLDDGSKPYSRFLSGDVSLRLRK